MIKRICPKCGGTLVLLTSIDKKLCADCHSYIEWKLDEGQQSIFNSSVDSTIEKS